MASHRWIVVLGGCISMVTLACSRQSLPQCRCVPPSPCWDSIPWESLNSTVGGKLMRLDQPLVKKCGGDKIASPACVLCRRFSHIRIFSVAEFCLVTKE
eukprot:m.184085 g.184085  ORF g.184085 m.184085 type:complete len:99 (+) comp18488_c0_seq17:189-485(+)